MRVTVLAPPLAPFKPVAPATEVLDQLGYRATLRVVPGAYFAHIQDSRRQVQIGLYGWFPDYPAASNMLEAAL